MSEEKLWDDLRDGMSARWHHQRHEDKYSKGIPDVSYGIAGLADGWIELKYVEKFPANPGKEGWDFGYRHFTADQRNWLTLRRKYGQGRVFLMCRFGDKVTAIWDWRKLAPLLGRASLNEILAAASAQWWHGPIDCTELEQVLASNRVIKPRFRA